MLWIDKFALEGNYPKVEEKIDDIIHALTYNRALFNKGDIDTATESNVYECSKIFAIFSEKENEGSAKFPDKFLSLFTSHLLKSELLTEENKYLVSKDPKLFFSKNSQELGKILNLFSEFSSTDLLRFLDIAKDSGHDYQLTKKPEKTGFMRDTISATTKEYFMSLLEKPEDGMGKIISPDKDVFARACDIAAHIVLEVYDGESGPYSLLPKFIINPENDQPMTFEDLKNYQKLGLPVRDTSTLDD